jgi:rhodanese-related sulfurtransferase
MGESRQWRIATRALAKREKQGGIMTRPAAFRRIDVASAREIVSRGDALILDIRDAESFSRGHIEGAALATKENFSFYLSQTPKEKPIVVCCYHGNSSQAVARHFAELGFADVFSLDGGYEAFAAAERAASTQLGAALQAFLAEHGFAPGAVDAHNKDRATPLMLAARLASPALVKELLRAGADIYAVNADGNQALWLACVGENAENIQLLVDAGINVQHVNANAATPLMFAASSGRAGAVALLLAAGADPLFETDLGLTAFDMASTAECLGLMRDAIRRRKAS